MRTIFTFLLFGAIVFPAFAQFSAAQVIDECRPCNTLDAQSGDFNNDGLRDVLITGFVRGELAWARNQGNGNFQKPEIILEGSFYLKAAYPGDLNNDGWLDIVIASQGGSAFGVGYLLNNGDGTFGELQDLTPTLADAIDVQAVDLDGDGWLDVVAASRIHSRLFWFRNEVGNGFSDEILIANDMHQTFGLSTGDLDGDGDIDLFTPADNAYATSLTWFRNNGEGEFTLKTFPNTGMNVYQVAGWELGDMDNDGDLDLVTSTLIDGKLRWHRNNGSGGFSFPLAIGSNIDRPQGLDLADVDEDGDLDIALAASGSDEVLIYFNTTGDSFAGPEVLEEAVNYVRTVHAADLNDDGRTDLVSVSANDDEIKVFWNEEDTDFSSLSLQDPPLAGLKILKTADLTGDGREDMIAYAEGDPLFAYLPQTQNGTFGEPVPIGDFDWVQGIIIVDLDGNGYQDVVTADPGEGGTLWYPNEDGVFAAPQLIGPYVKLLVAGDADSDGDLDLLGVNDGAQKAYYLANTGAGQFAEAVVIAEWDTYQNVVPLLVEDDYDGQPALYLTYNSSQQVTKIKFTEGSVAEEQLIITTDVLGVKQMNLMDVNGDLINDFILLTHPGDFNVYYGDGNGGFDQSPEALAPELAVRSFQVVDFDADGTDDLALFTPDESDNSIGRVWVAYGTPGNVLTDPVELTPYASPGPESFFHLQAFLTDLDNDSDIDLVYYRANYTFAAWKENLLITRTNAIPEKKAEVIAYPNPFRDQFYLQGELWDSGQISRVALRNAQGQVLTSATVGVYQQPLLPTYLPQGTYYLVCYDQEGRQLQVIPVVKQ